MGKESLAVCPLCALCVPSGCVLIGTDGYSRVLDLNPEMRTRFISCDPIILSEIPCSRF